MFNGSLNILRFFTHAVVAPAAQPIKNKLFFSVRNIPRRKESISLKELSSTKVITLGNRRTSTAFSKQKNSPSCCLTISITRGTISLMLRSFASIREMKDSVTTALLLGGSRKGLFLTLISCIHYLSLSYTCEKE